MIARAAPRPLTPGRTAGAGSERPAPRNIRIAAHVVALCVLPAGVWRIVLGFGLPMGFARASLEADHMPGWGTVQVICLSVVTEALALLTLGLVRPWGEVVPRWVPLLHGRRIPPLAAVVPATIGGLALIPLWTYPFVGLFTVDAISGAGWRVLIIVCYLPTLLWGPLLLWVTHDYYRRRTR